MLMEELFSRGVMTMGPCRNDPARQVGVFRPEAVAELPAIRKAEMEKFRWICGEWSYENRVPATRCNPAYTDVGTCRFSLCEKEAWVCIVEPGGAEMKNITFDPFGRQWIYMQTRGSYGLLRSAEGWVGEQIVFTGSMTMLGINCEWRMSWRREGEDAFGFVNEEMGEDGRWEYIDEWRFVRKAG